MARVKHACFTREYVRRPLSNDKDAGREVASTDGITGYQYQYDLADRLLQVDNAGGVVPEVQLDFQYDFEGNRTWMGDSLGGAIGYTWANQRLESLRMTTEESKSAQVDFNHDTVGRLSSASRMTNENPATTPSASSGTTLLTMDLLDRVTAITHQKVGASTTTLSQFSYSYDANGRLVSSAGPEGSLSFAQDANGQLISVTVFRGASWTPRKKASNQLKTFWIRQPPCHPPLASLMRSFLKTGKRFLPGSFSKGN